MENASLKTADRAAKEKTQLIREIDYDLDLLTIYELKVVKNLIEARFHL